MYSFGSNPRAVRSRAKTLFRPEDSENLLTKKAYENVMYDSRVVRGSTYSGKSLNGSGLNKQYAKRKVKSGFQRRNPSSNIYNEVRELNYLSEPVDVSKNLVEQTEEIKREDVETQTNKFLTRPQTPPYIPAKTGVDQGTQIEEEDNLFDFDEEVKPILEVIVSKTLEQSLMEVLEEEEMKYLERRRKKFENENENEKQRIMKMEEEELQRVIQKNKKVEEETLRLEQELDVCKKVAARNFFKSFIGDYLVNTCFEHLAEVGHFRDRYRDAVTLEFLPWLVQEMSNKVMLRKSAKMLSHELINHALQRRSRLASEARILSNELAREEKCLKEELEETKPINIFLHGVDLFGTDKLGPIALDRHDTIEEAEEKIHLWVLDNFSPDFESPAGGYLSLAFGMLSESVQDVSSYDPSAKLEELFRLPSESKA